MYFKAQYKYLFTRGGAFICNLKLHYIHAFPSSDSGPPPVFKARAFANTSAEFG